VASGGKFSTLAKSFTVRLRADDVTPGSCTTGLSSDPVTLNVHLEDDDGDLILDRSTPGVVCTANKMTDVKFTARFEGPKNCEGSLAPGHQVTHGDLFVALTTDDGLLNATRQIACKSDTVTPTPTPATPTPATPTPGPAAVFTLTPPAHYHVTMGDALTFTVTATQGGNPLVVNASGLPTAGVPATFIGGTFFWVGAFAGANDNGRHEVTFTAGGDSTVAVVGTTEFAIEEFALVDPLTAEPWPGNIIPIPVGGQQNVWAQVLCRPFGELTPNCQQGSNSWANFIWSILNPAIADFFDLGVTAGIDGLAPGMTPVEARFTDATLGEVSAAATLDVQ
jgi:hypothetical protein